MIPTIILDPFSGISGDMVLGALVDVGAPFDALQEALGKIPELNKVTLRQETVKQGLFRATRITVTCPHEHHHRGLTTIRGLIEAAPLPQTVRDGAVKTFTHLAEAEAKVHGHDVEKVHFHEVGALDAIADIVGAHALLHSLGSPQIVTRPIALGSGTVSGAHGEIPVPAPATVELLGGFATYFGDIEEELTTPTGAAIIASTARPLPPEQRFVGSRVGYGAGGREGKRLPNVLRVMLGTIEESKPHVCVVTTTIDDMNPEHYGFLMDVLFENGALDVYFASIMMKKSRPGVEVTMIADESNVYTLTNLLMTNTTTLGVRIAREERVELERSRGSVETTFGTIQIKIAVLPGGRRVMSPEYESCKAAAIAASARIQDVYEAARAAWQDDQAES